MTSRRSLAVVGAFVFAVSVNSLLAQTASTVPVGFIKITLPAAANASNPSNTPVAVPLYKVAAFTGAVATVSGTASFTVTSGTFTANQFTSAPHLVHMKSGNSVGRHFLIMSHTANQVTVDSRGLDLTTGIAANDLFEVLPAWTLATLFNPNPFATGADYTTVDNVLLWNGASFDTYFHNGTAWQQVNGSGDKGATIVYPDEGMFITHRALASLDITLLGTVPSTNEKSDIEGASATLLANRFPVNLTLSGTGQALNLQSLPGWVSGQTADAADTVYLWNGKDWDACFYDGANWRQADAIQPINSKVIPAGTAMLIYRANAGTATLTQALPYTP